MGRIVVTEFVSLDGVMEAPGGEDFKYPGWTFEFDRGDDGNQFKLDEIVNADAHLLGRVTYESFANAWPSREGAFADRLNEDQVRRLIDPVRPGVEQHHGAERRRDGGGLEAEAVDRRGHPRRGEPPARPGDARERPRRRDPPDGLPGRPRHRAQAVRRHERQEDMRLADSNPVGSEGVMTLVYERAAD